MLVRRLAKPFQARFVGLGCVLVTVGEFVEFEVWEVSGALLVPGLQRLRRQQKLKHLRRLTCAFLWHWQTYLGTGVLVLVGDPVVQTADLMRPSVGDLLVVSGVLVTIIRSTTVPCARWGRMGPKFSYPLRCTPSLFGSVSTARSLGPSAISKRDALGQYFGR